ncbi:MAG: hypothetical protein P8166_10460 [Candidatus Thiodiazotropha sp.]
MSQQDGSAPTNLPNTPFMALVLETGNGVPLTLIDVPGCPEPGTKTGMAPSNGDHAA